jgi:hypothetical protein
MDNPDVTVPTDDDEPAAIGFPVVSSVDKLRAISAELTSADTDDPMQAALLSVLSGITPMLIPLLPSDPAELDALLLTGARWMLTMRSDGAWQPEDLDELFMGPAAAAATAEG